MDYELRRNPMGTDRTHLRFISVSKKLLYCGITFLTFQLRISQSNWTRISQSNWTRISAWDNKLIFKNSRAVYSMAKYIYTTTYTDLRFIASAIQTSDWFFF